MKKIILKNGLTVYLYEDKRRHSVFVNLITNLGGNAEKYEYEGNTYTLKNGMAHLLEHLLIESSSYGNLMHVFGEMGMQTNGTTYTERTEFYFEGTEKIEEALTILIKAINEAPFQEEDVLKVKNAIYEEIRMGNDHKYRRLFKLGNEALFKNYAYRNGIGELEDVESFTFDEVKRVYDAFYTFSNQTLFIAGNFEEEALLKVLENICSEIDCSKKGGKLLFEEEQKEVALPSLTHHMPTGKPLVALLYKIDISHLSSRDRLALDFYITYFFDMNFSNLTPFKVRLAEEGTIIGGLGSHLFFFKDILQFGVIASTEKENLFIEEISKVIENPVLDEELFTSLNKESRIHIGLREENIHKYVSPFISNLFTFDYPYPDTVEQIETYHFEEFKKMITSLDFSQKSIIKIENLETDVEGA